MSVYTVAYTRATIYIVLFSEILSDSFTPLETQNTLSKIPMIVHVAVIIGVIYDNIIPKNKNIIYGTEAAITILKKLLNLQFLLSLYFAIAKNIKPITI